MAARADAIRARILDEHRDPERGARFADDVMTVFSGAIGFDGYCLFGVDPITHLRSVMFSRNGLEAGTERLLHNETVEHDYNRYQELVRRPEKAGILAASGSNQPSSPRLHEILRPEGYSSELRLALVSNNRYWGALSLFRDDRRRPFTADDAGVADELGGALALAVRRYQIGCPGRVEAPPLSGVVGFDRLGRVVHVSDEAQQWLGLLAESWEGGAVAEDVMRVVHEVASAATGDDGSAPLCRVRMPAGGWLVISGTRLGSADIDVVVQLRPGDVRTVAPAFATLCGLTERESAVLSRLAHGGSAKQMARSLSVSVLTLNDHLRSIYRKAGVRGRDELLALLT